MVTQMQSTGQGTPKKDEPDIDTLILECLNPDPKSVKKTLEYVASNRPGGKYSRQALTPRLASLVAKGVLKSTDNPDNGRETLYGFPDAIDRLQWGRSRDDVEFTTLEGLVFQEISNLVADWLTSHNRDFIDLECGRRAKIVFGAVRTFEGVNGLIFKRPWYILTEDKQKISNPKRFDQNRMEWVNLKEEEVQSMRDYSDAYTRLFLKKSSGVKFEGSAVKTASVEQRDLDAIRRGDDILMRTIEITESHWMEFFVTILNDLRRSKKDK